MYDTLAGKFIRCNGAPTNVHSLCIMLITVYRPCTNSAMFINILETVSVRNPRRFFAQFVIRANH